MSSVNTRLYSLAIRNETLNDSMPVSKCKKIFRHVAGINLHYCATLNFSHSKLLFCRTLVLILQRV